MIQKYLLTIIYCTTFVMVKSQSISPSESTELCPGVEITFTVTVPGTLTSIAGAAVTVAPTVTLNPYNISSSGGNTTFNFNGRFADYNNNQTFRVVYSTGSHDFTFTKIKSLITPTFASQISITPTFITANRCQSQNFNITFTNVQYSNQDITPPTGFGTITTYEYLLPTGWILNGTTSNGSSWIPGNNNVTVTSDLTHGIGGSIQVRAVNGCGTGLQPGQPTSISVLRPAPTLTITGGADVLCSGTSTYTVNGVPTGATISWGISNTNIASIPIPSTGTSVTLTKTGGGVVVLTANVTDCIQTYPVTKSITLGAAYVSSTYTYNGSQQPIHLWGADQYYNPLCSGVTSNIIADVQGQSSVTWSKVTSSPEAIPWTQTSNGVQFNFWNFGQTVIFEVDASNICGTTTQQYAFQSINCGGPACKIFSISPNPAKSSFRIIKPRPNIPICRIGIFNHGIIKNPQYFIQSVKIYDRLGNIKSQIRYAPNTKQDAEINTSMLKTGVYFVDISDGKTTERHQLVITQ